MRDMEQTLSELTRMLVEFHETYDAYMSPQPTGDIPAETVELRRNLITEEYEELMEALDSGELVEIAKEAADLLYVVVGTMIAYGLNAEDIVREVHASNMSKLGTDGKPILRESDNKVLKGPNYFEPDVAGVIENQGSLIASLRPRARRLY